MNKERPVEWKRSTSVLNNEFKLTSELKNEGKPVFALEADGKLTSSQFLTSVEAVYKGEKSFLKVDVDYKLPEAGINVRGGSPFLKEFGSQDTFELKATVKKTGEIYETDVLAKTLDNVTFRITNKVELTQAKKSFDILVAASEEPTRRVFLLVNDNGNSKYNVEAIVRWGDGGKYVTTKGDLSRSSEAFDATMTLDSPELNFNKYNVKIGRKSSPGSHALEVKVEGNGKEQMSAVFDYARKEERSGLQKSYEGSLTVKSEMKGVLSLFNFDGKFHVEDNKLDRQRDSEEGRQVRATFEITKDGTPIKATAVAKSSDKEKRFQVSLCKNNDAVCQNGDVHFRHQHESNGDLEYALKIVAESVENGSKSVRGLNIRTTKSHDKMEHTTKLIMKGDQDETVGYRVYKQGSELGSEILLPERVIALVLVGESPTDGTCTGSLSFYVDKTRQPERKISLVFSSAKESRMVQSGYARNFDLSFKHPDLGKDLRVSTKFAIGGEKSLIDIKTILDVFKADSEIVVVYRVHKEQVSDGNSYKGEWSVKSKVRMK
jgi:hypothetical protein